MSRLGAPNLIEVLALVTKAVGLSTRDLAPILVHALPTILVLFLLGLASVIELIPENKIITRIKSLVTGKNFFVTNRKVTTLGNSPLILVPSRTLALLSPPSSLTEVEEAANSDIKVGGRLLLFSSAW